MSSCAKRLCTSLKQISTTEVGNEPSVGSAAGSYDNPLADAIIGLCKTPLIRENGPRRDLDHVEYATLEYVGWFDNRRLLEPIAHISPAEREANCYSQQDPARLAGRNHTSLQ